MGTFMKQILNIVLLTSICVGLISTQGNAQDDKNMAITFDPVGLLGGAIPFTFRARLADHFSIGISGYDKFFNLTKKTVNGVGGGLSAKFHLSSVAFNDGWYIKPEAMAGYWSIGDAPDVTHGYSVEPRLTVGYDWIWPSGFNLALGLGIKYIHFIGDQTKVTDLSGFGFHEFFPNFDVGIGWAF